MKNVGIILSAVAVLLLVFYLSVDAKVIMFDANGAETQSVPYTPTVTCDGLDGGRADETGYKVWCWYDIALPNLSEIGSGRFSDGELHVDSECSKNQVTQIGDRLKFRVDASAPITYSDCANDFNMRAEIRTAPWNVRHQKGTEEWFGWSYTFGNDYNIDLYNEWMMFQVYPGPRGLSPQLSLQILNKNQFPNHEAGELFVVNGAYPQNGSASDYVFTGISPKASQTLHIVVHVIWGDATNGLLQVWIDDTIVYNKKVPTVFPDYPWGGNAKWGIYKFPWRDSLRVRQSINQGTAILETYMGTLRMITRTPKDPDYGKDSYQLVRPK